MKTNLSIKKLEAGQVIPLVVLMMIAIIAMVALILDGGSIMSNRRTAQAAADAGALAGAKQLCMGASDATAKLVAENYAIEKNKATTAVATPIQVSKDGKTFVSGINVQASVSNGSFFAGILGIDSLLAKAEAEAGCFPPDAGKYLLPVAWACRNPAPETPSATNTCPGFENKALDYTTEFLPLINENFNFHENILPNIYIVMDSNPEQANASIGDLDFVCQPEGFMNCDINGDGSPDYVGNSERGWVSFNGETNASELVDAIVNGSKEEIKIHTWLPSTVPPSNAYKYIQENKAYFLPVFNGKCLGDPSGSTNPCQVITHEALPLEPGEEDTVVFYKNITTFEEYYHISSFAAFYVTCVDDPGDSSNPGKPAKCPGHLAAVKTGLLDKNDKSVEGYFIKGYPKDFGLTPGTGGTDTGIYIVSLTK